MFHPMSAITPAERRAHEEALLDLARASAGTLDELLPTLAAGLQGRFPQYTGVYFYWMAGPGAGPLTLRAFRGRATEHVRIPVGQGICGRAAREARTVVVDDVNADPAYLACSLETRSEIVVPVMRGGDVLGEIDIDSDVAAAFGEEDRVFLERLADLIAARAR
jgi:L-methionine (R)-S-oxide reductase